MMTSPGRNSAVARRKNAPTNGGMAAWKATLRCCDEVRRKNRRGARRNEYLVGHVYSCLRCYGGHDFEIDAGVSAAREIARVHAKAESDCTRQADDRSWFGCRGFVDRKSGAEGKRGELG